MPTRRLVRRLIMLMAALVPATAALTVTGAAPASASGCNTVATYAWSNNCNVSHGDVSWMVAGVQEIVFVVTGGPNCGPSGDPVTVFGDATKAAVKCFQNQVGIGVDGIVGPVTWTHLRNDLHFDYRGSGWTYFTSPGFPPGFDIFRQWTSSGIWYVQDSGTGKWHQMNTNLP
jgi:Putative peptidoglycan binding domain